MPDTITLNVNGVERQVTAGPNSSVLSVLREHLGLTGSKYGCGESACGACTVLLDGEKVHSCVTPVSEALGKKVTTIEGLGQARLHSVQEAFLEEGGFQCGYCTPGMIMAAVALLQKNPSPTDVQIREGMEGNVCRCGAYVRILRAIHRAAGFGSASQKEETHVAAR